MKTHTTLLGRGWPCESSRTKGTGETEPAQTEGSEKGKTHRERSCQARCEALTTLYARMCVS